MNGVPMEVETNGSRQRNLKQKKMHSDVEAPDVVRRHYRTEYSNDALRRAKHRIRRLMREVTCMSMEMYYVKALSKVWMEHARNFWSTTRNQ